MEFKGTKGKWYRNTKSKIVSSVYSENEEKLIHISGKNNDVSQANALLISKAPEMLYLLNDLLHDKGINDVSRREIELLIKSATEIN